MGGVATVERTEARGVVSQAQFDLFVIYARADAAFVRSVLLPGIGLPATRVLLVDELRPGVSRVLEIERGVSQSRFTLAVLSPACLADGWATLGEQLASHLSMANPRVIPLYLTDCELPVHIDFRVALDFRREEDREFELARLRQLLQAPAPMPTRSEPSTLQSATPRLPARGLLWRRAALWLVFASIALTAFGIWSRAHASASDRKSAPAHLDRARARAKLLELGFEPTPAVFFQRIIEGDSAAVALFLAAGMDPESLGRDPPHITWVSPLCVAARHDHVDVAKALLAAGANLNESLWCASNDDSHVLTYLLTQSPSDAAVLKAIWNAAGDGQSKALAVLLPHARNIRKDGGDALIAAASEGSIETSRVAVVRPLLDAGVPVDSLDADGYSPLLRAAVSGRADTVELLLARGADLGRRGPAGETALHLAGSGEFMRAGLSDAAVARTLLAKGADVNAKNAAGETPLACALGRTPSDQEELIRTLVEHGADVNSIDAKGVPVLFRVVVNAPLVAFLLDRGAHIDAKTSFGSTALLRAVSSGWLDSAELLIRRGANCDIADASGQTARKVIATLEREPRERMLALLRKAKK